MILRRLMVLAVSVAALSGCLQSKTERLAERLPNATTQDLCKEYDENLTKAVTDKKAKMRTDMIVKEALNRGKNIFACPVNIPTNLIGLNKNIAHITYCKYVSNYALRPLLAKIQNNTLSSLSGEDVLISSDEDLKYLEGSYSVLQQCQKAYNSYVGIEYSDTMTEALEIESAAYLAAYRQEIGIASLVKQLNVANNKIKGVLKSSKAEALAAQTAERQARAAERSAALAAAAKRSSDAWANYAKESNRILSQPIIKFSQPSSVRLRTNCLNTGMIITCR